VPNFVQKYISPKNGVFAKSNAFESIFTSDFGFGKFLVIYSTKQGSPGKVQKYVARLSTL